MSDTRGPDPEAMNPVERQLAAAIDRRLQDEAGIFAAVRVGGDVAYLDGLVESDAQRDAASDLAASVAGIGRVQNDLAVEEIAVAGQDTTINQSVYADANYQMLNRELMTNSQPSRDDTEADFNDPIEKIGGDMTTDAMIAVEEGLPYMPPTDPIVRPATDDQDLSIVGGFGETAADEYPDLEATTALGDAPPGDEDIRAQVIEALRTDAATIDLVIEVIVRNGIAHLRGQVPTLDDAEAAEEVAGRVPTVREVREELEVAALG